MELKVMISEYNRISSYMDRVYSGESNMSKKKIEEVEDVLYKLRKDIEKGYNI